MTNSDLRNDRRISPSPWKRWSALLMAQEERVFLVLTLLIGALVGLVVVAFIVLTERFGARLYPAGGAEWRRFLTPLVGALVTGYLLFRYFPEARGSGVPQTKAALYARGGRITFGTVLGKFFCTSATLASGIPLGREGPAVQVGAGIASVLGRRLGLRPQKVQELIPVGAAAAVAAAFNTPLAAVLFALEEVVGDLHAPVLGSVVLASATSWAVLRLLLGNDPLFRVPQYQLVHPVEFLLYLALGVGGGFVSVGFTRLLLGLRERFLRLPRRTLWFQPVAGGALVGVMGWFIPQVMGVGYQHVSDVLNGNMALKLMLLLLGLKLIAVAVSYASGNAGGIFGPSLFLGAMLGGAVGTIGHQLLPSHTATAGAYALVGMGAAFAGVVRAPMTSVVMIFEVTRDYTVIVPLMISNLVSYFIASRLQREPIYEVLARQDGIHLPIVASRKGATAWQVVHVQRPASEVLDAKLTASQALALVDGSGLQAWPVVEEVGIIGILSSAQLRNLAGDPALAILPLQQVLDRQTFPHLHPDHSLHIALERMGATHLEVLPVVSRADVHRLEGIVTLADVLARYGLPPKDSG